MILRNSTIFILILIIYSSVAYASAFDVEAIPINDRISIDEFAIFKINIKNNLRQTDEYRIYTLSFPTWDVRTDPIRSPILLELEPGEEGSVEIVVDPLKIKDIGTYGVSINIRSKLTASPFTVPLKVSIISTTPLIGGYLPTVVTGVDVAKKVDPREDIPIKISLSNQNIIDYPELEIIVQSNLINKVTTTKLGPREDTTLEIIVNMDPLTSPQEDNLVVDVLRDGRSIITPIVRNIDIIEYTEVEIISRQKGFTLTRSRYNFIYNNNNYDDVFKVETTLLGSIFSSTSPKADTIKENGKRYFVWESNLENNSMQVTVTENFIPLFVVIALLIVVAVAYYVLRSPLHISKSASNIIKKEGGISEMTVVLHIKNRSNNKLNDIELTEFIPALVSIGKEVSIGSIQPTKILRHEKEKNTIVKWRIDHLEASEERVLSYKIEAKLSILGAFSLPAAKAVFKSKNKVSTTNSNRLTVDH